ncbi:MAG: hypothetical protein JW984_15100 [Deltaproteobacteria bacterium]|uniref:Uncharacterized protein n=1 Tax=Candidatus Zymogenus saltonus TaxID=2844893 RepID=A0A9D8KHC2_9DELT|nr:hypothetical protein [Candidatus Zymogenus saltonus]
MSGSEIQALIYVAIFLLGVFVGCLGETPEKPKPENWYDIEKSLMKTPRKET